MIEKRDSDRSTSVRDKANGSCVVEVVTSFPSLQLHHKEGTTVMDSQRGDKDERD